MLHLHRYGLWVPDSQPASLLAWPKWERAYSSTSWHCPQLAILKISEVSGFWEYTTKTYHCDVKHDFYSAAFLEIRYPPEMIPPNSTALQRPTKYKNIIETQLPSSRKQLHGLAYLLHVPHSPLHSQWLLRSLVCSAGKQQSSLLPLLLPLLLLPPLHWLVAELVSLWTLAAGSEQHQASPRLSETVILLACRQILYHPAGKKSRSETASLGSSPFKVSKEVMT